jgi:hypothetical protein
LPQFCSVTREKLYTFLWASVRAVGTQKELTVTHIETQKELAQNYLLQTFTEYFTISEI